MALVHQLALDVLPTSDLYSLALQDVSLYVPALSTQGGVLEIQGPKMPKPATLLTGIAPSFTRIVSAAELGWGSSNNRVSLPDGLYNLHYYLMPGTRYSVRRSHFRVVNLQQRINSLYCCSSVNISLPCSTDCADPARNETLLELVYLSALLDASVANVLRCGNLDRASQFYDYVLERVCDLERHC